MCLISSKCVNLLGGFGEGRGGAGGTCSIWPAVTLQSDVNTNTRRVGRCEDDSSASRSPSQLQGQRKQTAPHVPTIVPFVYSAPRDRRCCFVTLPQGIMLRWQPPPLNGQNGEITGYKIRYRKGSRRSEAAETTGGTQLLKLIDGKTRNSFLVLYCSFYFFINTSILVYFVQPKITNYKFASAGFTICTHTTSLTFDLTSDQEQLPRIRKNPFTGKQVKKPSGGQQRRIPLQDGQKQ